MTDLSDPDWTDTDLSLLQSLHAAGTPLAQIARRLGRSEEAIADHLTIVRSREAALPTPAARADDDDEWHGPDEEGDVTPPTGRADDDEAAWVHSAK